MSVIGKQITDCNGSTLPATNENQSGVSSGQNKWNKPQKLSEGSRCSPAVEHVLSIDEIQV